MRALVALMTSLTMLHFGLAGSGIACSATSAEESRDAMAMSDADTHAGHVMPPAAAAGHRPDAGRHQTDSHAPAQERCCESMSSCGVTTMASEVERASEPRLASRIPASPESRLASVATAPEPPPPKA